MLKNKTYLFLCIGLSIIFFMITNIQFWIPDYLVKIRDAPYETVVILFSVICITAPVGGAILSSSIGAKIGGYESPYALPICISFSLLISIFGMPVPFLPNEYNWLFYLLLWFMIFCGGVIVPLCTGVMISVVEPELRPQASALANLLYNLLGYFPAPFVYGFICEHTGGAKSNWGMISTFIMAFPSMMFICLAMYYKPDLRDYWVQKRKLMVAQYMSKHEKVPEKVIND